MLMVKDRANGLCFFANFLDDFLPPGTVCVPQSVSGSLLVLSVRHAVDRSKEGEMFGISIKAIT